MKQKSKIIAIVGATATGKSNLAINLAKEINGEIISADSRLIYKEYDIATAKPTEKEKEGIIHHLINIKNPDEDFSASDFKDCAKKLIQEIQTRGKSVIITGGTGFYLRILLEGLEITEVKPNKELREELTKKAEIEGKEAVYNILKKLDEKACEKIHPNNLEKVIRAIEISKTLKKPFSSTLKEKEAEYDVFWIGLDAKNREYLYEKINKRVEIMFGKGLEKEAFQLYKKYKNTKSYQNTIGYQEFIPYFNNEYDLNRVIELIKQNSRHYAKRQLTWFRTNDKINWFYIDENNEKEILEKILKNFN